MNQFPQLLKALIDKRKKENTLRSLASYQGLIDFLSNDYLGFAANEILFSRTFQKLLNAQISSNGSSGSRLISGNHRFYGELETVLISFYKAAAALVFNSGYDANLGFFGSVPQRGDVILYDELVHASIREGIRLSNAKSYSFAHNDIAALKKKIDLTLSRMDDCKGANVYVVTESVFSMDGDSPDLKAFVSFCSLNGYYLIVDEAHAVGVLGVRGEGLVAYLGLENQVFARIVTFGKAFGCQGAAVLGSLELKEYLINFAKSFIYTTALPPHTLATIITAHEGFKVFGYSAVKELNENIVFFKHQITELKLDVNFIPSNTAVQSCVFSGANKAKAISGKLYEKGFGIKAILSPTVPEGKERLRFCLHSFNSKEEIGLVLQLLSKYV